MGGHGIGARRLALDGRHRHRRADTGRDDCASGGRLRTARTRPAGSSKIKPRGRRHFPSSPCREPPARRAARCGASARPLLAAAAQLPVSLLPRLQEIVTSGADGVVLRLKDGLRAVVGDDEALAQKFVSLATVLHGVSLAGIGGIDLRVAAAPVLTPLVSPSNVHGKGDG